MSQQSSLTQSAHSVRQVLTAYRAFTAQGREPVHILGGDCRALGGTKEAEHPLTIPVAGIEALDRLLVGALYLRITHSQLPQ
jgi:hypothetical protein